MDMHRQHVQVLFLDNRVLTRRWRPLPGRPGKYTRATRKTAAARGDAARKAAR
jgi:hypothetical protein